ncbi:MAG: hypothetical protein QOJ53_1725 [Sphingomonadales bacterium]|nr:hypothetical protein [Sphingomonadales bacterium]MEA3045653.1 hypothetical protein [Sphingomonadales bacterium]MEA3047393.1 hypothetical protein [Sphingomonadales bacterium]
MRRTVERPKRPTPLQNPRQDTLQIPKHLSGRNAHHREAQARQMGIPRTVPLRPVATIVRLAVHLDR